MLGRTNPYLVIILAATVTWGIKYTYSRYKCESTGGHMGFVTTDKRMGSQFCCLPPGVAEVKE